MTGRLEGKIALVTGGASGIGAAVVARFLSEGARVVATDITDIPEAATDRLIPMRQDTRNEDDWLATIEHISASLGPLDILVNNAGISAEKSTGIADTSLEAWRRVLSVNLDGVFLGLKHGMRAMSGRGGAIVNVGSVHSFVAIPNSAAYCASKGGVLMLTKAAALEGAALPSPVRVNSIHPGYVDTPLLQSRMAQDPDRLAKVTSATPLQRLARPDEIAAALMSLVTDEASFITGTALCIDGGYTSR